jgi:CelD/BcsL family acetyltransferase involved in cellulose biosynthesis
MSLTFAKAVGEIRANARVAVIEDSGAIQAFFPYDLSGGNLAIPIGYPMNDLQGFISSGAPVDPRAVVRKASLHGWRFHHAPAEQRNLAPFYYRPDLEQSPVIEIVDGYDAYLESRSKTLLKHYRQQRRAMERRLGPVTLEWDTSRSGALSQLLDWKFARYWSVKQMFARDPTAQPIVEALAAAKNDDCRGQVNVLSAGERPIAGQLYLVGPRGLTGMFTAYDPSQSKFSPGTMLCFCVSEACTHHGIVRHELGYGELQYKLRLATGVDLVAAGAVWASRIEGLARTVVRKVYVDRKSDRAMAKTQASG